MSALDVTGVCTSDGGWHKWHALVMVEGTSGIYHVAHAYANPIVVSVPSATGRAYTMLCQTEWCYSGPHR